MKTLVFREHALLRMAERGIRHQDVRAALEFGEIIRHYPDPALWEPDFERKRP